MLRAKHVGIESRLFLGATKKQRMVAVGHVRFHQRENSFVLADALQSQNC